ncbi:MAG: alpha/beta fold hydrolase [Rubrobacter sp.]
MPLILCHGGPGLWDDQGPVAGIVEDLVLVHRWDQRGCGRSTGSGPYEIDRFVADLEALRVHFGHDRWMVGGHSRGAALALRYAVANPYRVVALLYVSGTGTGKEWRAAYRAERERRLTSEQRLRRDELKDRERDDAEEHEYRVLSWAPDYGDRDRAFELAASEAGRTAFQVNYECNAALNAETDAVDEGSLLAGCRALDVPVLVVDGAEDPRPAWALDVLVGVLPRVERHTIAGAGHVPWLEDRSGFASILRGFLEHETRAGDSLRGVRDG